VIERSPAAFYLNDEKPKRGDTEPPVGRKQVTFSHFALGARAQSGEHNPLAVRAATAGGLGTTLPLSPAAFSGRRSISRHEL